MIDLKRILTATDFSSASKVALQYAVAFSQAFQAEVILCHVLESPDLLAGLPPVAEGYIPPNLAELQEQNARVQCEQILAEAGLSNARLVLRHGRPAHVLTVRHTALLERPEQDDRQQTTGNQSQKLLPRIGGKR